MAGGKENLRPCRDTETAKARGKLGGIKSGQVKKEKKLMSQIMAEYLIKEHEVNIDNKKKKLSGSEFINIVMSKVLENGGSPAVSLMKVMSEVTEGNKLNIETPTPINITIKGVESGNTNS